MKNMLMNIVARMSRLLAVDANLREIGAEVNSILRVWVGPLMIALGGVGAVYIIILGIQYAKGENDSKRAEVKTRLVNCIIGVIAILVLGSVCIGIDWAKLVQVFGYAGE